VFPARRSCLKHARIIIKIAHRVGERPAFWVLQIQREKWVVLETFQNGSAVGNFCREEFGESAFARSDISDHTDIAECACGSHSHIARRQPLSRLAPCARNARRGCARAHIATTEGSTRRGWESVQEIGL